MLTANDVQNIKFTNSRGKYKASEVDEFLDRCAETISALTSARNELEKKLEVLALFLAATYTSIIISTISI